MTKNTILMALALAAGTTFAADAAKPAAVPAAPAKAEAKAAAPAKAEAAKPARPAANVRPMRPSQGPNARDISRFVTNGRLTKDLGLSEDQVKKIQELSKQDREATMAARRSQQEAMMAQMKLMQAEKLDEAAIFASIDKVYDARKEMEKADVKRLIAIRNVLTDEQWKKASEELKNMRQRRFERNARPPMPPPAAKPGEKPAEKPAAKPDAKPDAKPAEKPAK